MEWTDAEAEAEAPILWPLDGKNWLLGKDPDAGQDWEQEEVRTRERTRRLGGAADSRDVSLSKLWETVKDREIWCAASMGSQRVRHYCVTEQEIDTILTFHGNLAPDWDST